MIGVRHVGGMVCCPVVPIPRARGSFPSFVTQMREGRGLRTTGDATKRRDDVISLRGGTLLPFSLLGAAFSHFFSSPQTVLCVTLDPVINFFSPLYFFLIISFVVSRRRVSHLSLSVPPRRKTPTRTRTINTDKHAPLKANTDTIAHLHSPVFPSLPHPWHDKRIMNTSAGVFHG